MSNKHPQYLTPNGFVRTKKKPRISKIKSSATKTDKNVENSITLDSSSVEVLLSTKIAKRVIKKRQIARQKSGGSSISPQAAKAIADALKGMLHS